MKKCLYKFCICLVISFPHVFAAIDIDFNVTDFIRHRERRSLIFEGGGQVKFVIGPSIPVDLGDPISWRSLVCSYNLHGGHYMIPTAPLYPWDKFENIFARSMQKLSKNRVLEETAAEQYWTDDSRLLVYTIAEKFLNKHKAESGRACLLRAICENAQVQQHIGILAEVLSIVLTPGKENIYEVYGAAYEAGKSGVDCLRMYEDCPMGSSILDDYWKYF